MRKEKQSRKGNKVKRLFKYQIKFLLVIVMLMLVFPYISEAKSFLAYSLNEAESRIRASGRSHTEVIEIGGINYPIGIVYDKEKQDLIIVGEIKEGKETITLDDLAVAIRAILVKKKWPVVSIDKTEETKELGKQIVRFEGGIEGTNFGKKFFEADVLLKKFGLGEKRLDIWGVKSYFDLYKYHWEKEGNEDSVRSRFWFKADDQNSYIAIREGVAVIDKLVIKVETELQGVTVNGNFVKDVENLRDKVGDDFAIALTANYNDISESYEEIKRLDTLYRLVALATGIREFVNTQGSLQSNTNFWIKDYKVSKCDTPLDYPLLVKASEVNKSGKTFKMVLDGGIELKALIRDLNDGEATAFRNIVLRTRPKGNPLVWKVPLGNWSPSGSSERMVESEFDSVSAKEEFGMSLTMQISPVDSSINKDREPLTNYRSTPLQSEIPKFNVTNKLTPQKYSPNVGGVMLQGVAKISGGEQVKVDLASGNFSLIVDGQNARLAPEAYRKFITALWAVYYSNQDPGVSIDPLGCFYFDPYDPERNQKFESCLERYQKKEEKHMVQYIGKVINTDLGRVMREADYLMKKWSVGTERLAIAGFKNPDEYRGWKTPAGGGSSRFWFVPQDMKFKRGGDLLLYEDGRMTVKTEFMFRNEGDVQADPYNEKFADFLTKHYSEISSKYPVYGELFDYAKMVSLAKYLKEQGVPLFWFLMANKDLVITEDSPGTVDALAKGSDYYRNLYIMGGVDLSFDVRREGNYVYDTEAVKAIHEALSQRPSSSPKITSISDGKAIPATSEPFSFNLGKDSYSVIPQHTLTSGKDRYGVRYQTDIALRGTGLQLTDQALEMTKYKIIRWEMAMELNPTLQGKDMNKLSESEIDALNKKIKETREQAEAKTERICEKLKSLSNKRYRNEKEFAKALEENIGKEQTDKFKRLIMESAYYDTKLELVRYYKPGQQHSGEFGKGWHLLVPYRINPSGSGKREFLNVMIPEKIAVVNVITGEEEILAFSTDRYTIAGYVPEKIESSQVIGLFIMSDASYRLADKLGNEFWFNGAGYLTDMVFSEDHHIRFEYLKSFTDAFDKAPYRVTADGTERIEFLNVSLPKKMEVKNLLHGGSEILVFSDKGDIAGYFPGDHEKSRFKILALMSNASFRLLDKNGHEMAFTPSGDFEGIAFPDDRPIVSSLSQGNQKISFRYTLDESGAPMIASADLSEGSALPPNYVVHYQYDDEGRLYSVKGSYTKEAMIYGQPVSVMAAELK